MPPLERYLIPCFYCDKEVSHRFSDVLRAYKAGCSLYCGRECAGLGRRVESPKSPRNENWKAMKAAYDREYRKKNRAALKEKKAKAYAIYGPTHREKERQVRAARMPKHLEYCRRPEYRQKKQVYDAIHRAEKQFGSFAEAALALGEIEQELNSRATWTDRKQANGTLNKSIQRRREYERFTGNTKADRNRPQGLTVGDPKPDQV